MSEKVFAYGSNMCSGRLRDYGVRPERCGNPAMLSDYRLLFDKKSKDGSSKANIRAHSGSHVWGVLYTLSDADINTLDDGEKGYRRVPLSVRLEEGTNTDAWAYLVEESPDGGALRPYSWYTRFLIEGAREHSLPSEYIAGLEKIAAVQDTRSQRDREKRALVCGSRL